METRRARPIHLVVTGAFSLATSNTGQTRGRPEGRLRQETGFVPIMSWRSFFRAVTASVVVALALTGGTTLADDAKPSATPSGATTQSNDVKIRAVLELFTSQGCSSCPPADALLKTYANDPSIVALSMPVDYWDYIGWKDTFAVPQNAERQKAYAKARGDGAIYTPQIVVNGLLHVNGAQKAEIDNAIELTAHNAGLPRVPIHFWQEANTLNIAAEGVEDSTIHEATIWLGVVQTEGSVQIENGENAGQKLLYTNVVRQLTPVGLWKGQPILIQIPRAAVMQPATQKSVVLIQEGKAGAIIGAAWTGLW